MMVWYFLAGFVSGVVGTFMFLGFIGRKMEERKRQDEV